MLDSGQGTNEIKVTPSGVNTPNNVISVTVSLTCGNSPATATYTVPFIPVKKLFAKKIVWKVGDILNLANFIPSNFRKPIIFGYNNSIATPTFTNPPAFICNGETKTFTVNVVSGNPRTFTWTTTGGLKLPNGTNYSVKSEACKDSFLPSTDYP
jgi:hypothetical protein